MLNSHRKHEKETLFLVKKLDFYIVTFTIFLLFSGVLIKAYFLPISLDTNQEIPSLIVSGGDTLVPSCSPNNPPLKVVEEIPVIVTAYSSTPCQTDDSPFVTASGSGVKEGVAANNLLPFGTKIRIPEIFGEKVFIVEDRMNWRKGYYMVDIWFPDYGEALAFGAKKTNIEILGK